ncbi:hypothetical protein [Mariniflexile sp. AS56]|uniref:hypothetical protein n=1 Tax=Mariniflexile sp. AS56 TaxID=3063957 RepID=UPI0026F08A9A|nr:hypothetical protein [Mariniflexile sp. AS56]MDO7170614.1 hypothetical protein [Mariniflexile sp. AS56]
MKLKLNVLFFITFFSAITLSCDTSSTTRVKNTAEYNSSLDTWNTLKETHGTSYTYSIRFSSFSRNGSTTTITVNNNAVISRIYEAYSMYDSTGNYLGYENRLILDSYTENEASIGSNNNGALPLTIDALYTACLSKYLIVDTDKNTVVFNVDDSSIIKDCYYIPNGCQDDCSFGINISDFSWL